MSVDCNLEVYPREGRPRMWTLDRLAPFYGVEGWDKTFTVQQMLEAIEALPETEVRPEYCAHWRKVAVRYLRGAVNRFGPGTSCRILNDLIGGTDCDERLYEAKERLREGRRARRNRLATSTPHAP